MDYQIGKLTEICGVNKETIRYYERKKLLQKPTKNSSGYRIYSKDTVKRVDFIKRMQELGFSLSEIDRLLGIVDKDEARCADMYEFVSTKEKEVRKKIDDLQRVSLMLSDLKRRCPDEKELHDCPILETLIEV
ncbi:MULTISPECIES: Hg(II)-responsive transcriptional regulator [unclassified Exiguobacterium]|uniref:Hg(II)-responsive transcriptional regulator n=1 Tax=unclassified Exiguobacterium TaxID=2644629 RepID=UPI001BE66A78|nr:MULTISPECIES: Hg(II)-responsive transcriptional regulator [unclassified Exiguobacterium]